MLVVGGDSYSCWPAEEFDGNRNRCWPAITAKKLKLNLVDYARAGCSNDRIFRYCMPETLNKDTSIVVIFWSSFSRFEVGYQGKVEQIMPGAKTSVLPKDFIANNVDLYLQHCKNLLYMISVQESCKKNNIIFLQKNMSTSDCWWDNTYETFCNFMKEANLFDFLSDNQILEKYRYLENLYSKIDNNTIIGNRNESLQSLIDTSKEFHNHPTYKGHQQMSDLVIGCIKKQMQGTHHGKTV